MCVLCSLQRALERHSSPINCELTATAAGAVRMRRRRDDGLIWPLACVRTSLTTTVSETTSAA